MNAPASIKSQRIQRAALIFLLSLVTWFAILAVPVAEAHGYFNCQAMRQRFVAYLIYALFPYITSVFDESVRILLTILHWTLARGGFVWIARNLSVRVAFIVAFVSLPLLGGLVFGFLHVVGVMT